MTSEYYVQINGDGQEKTNEVDDGTKAKEKLDKKTNYIEVTIQWSAPICQFKWGRPIFSLA